MKKEQIQNLAKEFCEAENVGDELTPFWTDVLGRFLQSMIDQGHIVEADNWISVKDRLPNPAQLVFLYNNGVLLNAYRFYPKGHVGMPEDLFFDLNGKDATPLEDITHWMPLPAAPGESTVSSAGKEVKWWPCKFGEVVAKGHYMVKTSREGITGHNHMVIDELNPTVYYYYAVSLFKIQLPGESSPASTVMPEISDEDILKGAELNALNHDARFSAWVGGAKWYREQLKRKSCQ